MGTSPGDGAGWAAGLDTGGAAGGLVHGKCAIFLLHFNFQTAAFPLCCEIYSPVFTPAALSSMSHLGMEGLFQPLNPKIKDQMLLPAHDMDKSARQDMETLAWPPKQLRGFPTVITHVYPRQNLQNKGVPGNNLFESHQSAQQWCSCEDRKCTQVNSPSPRAGGV